jgi:hypothetical protein
VPTHRDDTRVLLPHPRSRDSRELFDLGTNPQSKLPHYIVPASPNTAKTVHEQDMAPRSGGVDPLRAPRETDGGWRDSKRGVLGDYAGGSARKGRRGDLAEEMRSAVHCREESARPREYTGTQSDGAKATKEAETWPPSGKARGIQCAQDSWHALRLTVNGNSIVRSGTGKDLGDFDIAYRAQDMWLEQIRAGRTVSEGGQLAT